MNVTFFSAEHNWPGKFPEYNLYEIPKGSVELDCFAYNYTRDLEETVIPACSGDIRPYTEEHPKCSIKSKLIQTNKNIIFISWAQHYWHFHGESVAQILLYKTLNVFKKYTPEDTLIVTQGENSKYREIIDFLFQELNLKAYEFVQLKRGECYKTSKTLVTTTNMIMGGTVPPPWLYEPINQRISQLNYTPTQEIIFLSREDANYRKLMNEAELLNTLQKTYNITTYEFSKVPYIEQVRLMNTAKVVIQISGTHGINNLYINPKNTKVLILSPADYTGRGTDILNKLKASYKLVKANKEEFTFDHKNMRRATPHNNFYVDENEVLIGLKELIHS
jgi:hypothetical protein